MITTRPTTPDDAEATLAVFHRAIRGTASADYSPEQVAAWASDDIDPDDWRTARSVGRGVVAVSDGEVVGFTELTGAGHVEMMFVDPGHARRGVAGLLLDAVTAQAVAAGATALTTDASITARPFFAAHGFEVRAEQHPVRRGVTFTNYRMERQLAGETERQDAAGPSRS